MGKKRISQDKEQSNVLFSKLDKLSMKTVTLSNEFISTFIQSIYRDK